MKTSIASAILLALLAGCDSAPTRPTSGPMASGRDRTFNVPVYGADASPAHNAATVECRKLGLFPKPLRNEGSRIVFECVSEAPGR